MKLVRYSMLAFSLLLTGSALVAQQSGPRAELSNKKKDKGPDTTVRSVEGVVRDATDSPIEGAVVKIKDTKSLQIRSYITNADGMFRFHGLSRKVNYELKADYNEASSPTKTLSVFDDRLKATINLKIEPKS